MNAGVQTPSGTRWPYPARTRTTAHYCWRALCAGNESCVSFFDIHQYRKVFNQGIFVCDLSATLGYEVGFALIGQPTNRDRGLLPDMNARRDATARVIGDILLNAPAIRCHSHALITSWAEFLDRVMAMLHRNAEETFHLHTFCGQQKNTTVPDLIHSCYRASPAGRDAAYPTTSDLGVHVRDRCAREVRKPCEYHEHDNGVGNISVHLSHGVCVVVRECDGMLCDVQARQLYHNLVQSQHYVTLDRRMNELAQAKQMTLTEEQQQIFDKALVAVRYVRKKL